METPDQEPLSLFLSKYSFNSTLAGTPRDSHYIYAPFSNEKVKVAQLCLTLCNPMDYPVYGILNTGVGSLSLLQGIFPTQVSHIASGFFTSWAIREAPFSTSSSSFSQGHDHPAND